MEDLKRNKTSILEGLEDHKDHIARHAYPPKFTLAVTMFENGDVMKSKMFGEATNLLEAVGALDLLKDELVRQIREPKIKDRYVKESDIQD